MKNFIVFDNGGKSADRFTIINMETADVFGASENPHEPNGTGRWIGNIAYHRTVLFGAGWRQRQPAKKVIQIEIENYVNNAKLDPEWLGVEIPHRDIPDALRSYIDELDVDDPRTHSRARIASFGEFQRAPKAVNNQ
ncbi:MAG TPA: hypothetical protein VG605_03500 [Puia sp.]|nr:hypothetical protein [Puia sp.]